MRKELKQLPIISMFYGISIKMYVDEHNPPHFHAFYQGYEGCFNLDGELTQGFLPNKQRKLIEAWTLLHQKELFENWKLLEKSQQVNKIEPLQ